LKLNVLIVANLLQCLLNPQKVNPFIVKHVTRNTGLRSEEDLV
jgi:hypothetical protein